MNQYDRSTKNIKNCENIAHFQQILIDFNIKKKQILNLK